MVNLRFAILFEPVKEKVCIPDISNQSGYVLEDTVHSSFLCRHAAVVPPILSASGSAFEPVHDVKRVTVNWHNIIPFGFG